MSARGAREQTLLLAVLLVTAAIPPASVNADAMQDTGDESVFHVTQGTECYEIAAYGDGTTSVEDFYDYRRPENTDPSVYTYSSHGTRNLQENQVSNLFVYRGSGGYSLVMLHDELDDAPYGSTVTFRISGLPADREWVVEDDAYSGRDDEFHHGTTSSTIHWKWAPDRTDGAAVRGLGGDDYSAVTIDPAFNEAAAAWGDWLHSGGEHRIHSWRLLDGDGTAVSLTMDQPVSLASGGCPTDDPPDTTTTTSTTPTTTTSTTSETTTTTTTDATTTDTTTAETTTSATATTTTTSDETTQTTTEDGTTNPTTTTTTDGTATTTSTTTTEQSSDDDNPNDGDNSSDGDNTNDGDNSNERAYRDEDSEDSQSGSVPGAGGGQGATGGQSSADDRSNDPEPPRASANLSDADGQFGNLTLESNASGADLGIETDAVSPGDVRSPTPERDGFTALSFVRAEISSGEATRGSGETTRTAVEATANVTLSADRLEAIEATSGEVSLFRFENGSWTGVQTEQVGAPDDVYRFRANVTNATYAVGVERPAISVADLSVNASRVEVGEPVQVVATVANEGRANGTRSVTVGIDGTTVATRNVSVPAGATREVVLTRQFDAAGPREIGVGDEHSSVVVEGVETTAVGTSSSATEATATTRATVSETAATNDPAPGVPGFGTGVALVALAGAVLAGAALTIFQRG